MTLVLAHVYTLLCFNYKRPAHLHFHFCFFSFHTHTMIHTRVYFMLLLFLAMTPYAIAWLQLPSWATSMYHFQWSPSSTDLIEDCSKCFVD